MELHLSHVGTSLFTIGTWILSGPDFPELLERDIFIHFWDMGPNEKLKLGKQTRLRPTSARQEVEITMKSKAAR
jgi:hypothetical protein